MRGPRLTVVARDRPLDSYETILKYLRTTRTAHGTARAAAPDFAHRS